MGAAFRHGCRLEVTTKDGRVLRHERLSRRGSPEDAVGEAEIVRKYRANVDGILSDAASEGLREDVMRLETLADTRSLTSRLVVDG
jgi:hypothetical protein